jgi:hypothetical protein
VAAPNLEWPSAEYIDVAQKTLFSKDRNPNVVIELPPPKPEPPMPALPFYSRADDHRRSHRVPERDGPTANRRGYHAGDKGRSLQAGDVSTAKASRWNGTARPSSASWRSWRRKKPTPAQQQAAAARGSTPPPAPTVKALASSPGGRRTSSRQIGIDVGGGSGLRACIKGDNSPNPEPN